MVVKNNSKANYVSGNVAYDYEKQKKVTKEVKPSSNIKPKKKKVNKNKDKIKIKLMLSIGIVFFMAFIVVGRYTTILTLSSEVRADKKEVEKIQKENQNLNVDIAKLNNLNVMEDAIAKYGLIKPTSENTYFISVNPLDKKDTKEDSKKSALTTTQRILGLIY